MRSARRVLDREVDTDDGDALRDQCVDDSGTQEPVPARDECDGHAGTAFGRVA